MNILISKSLIILFSFLQSPKERLLLFENSCFKPINQQQHTYFTLHIKQKCEAHSVSGHWLFKKVMCIFTECSKAGTGVRVPAITSIAQFCMSTVWGFHCAYRTRASYLRRCMESCRGWKVSLSPEAVHHPCWKGHLAFLLAPLNEYTTSHLRRTETQRTPPRKTD